MTILRIIAAAKIGTGLEKADFILTNRSVGTGRPRVGRLFQDNERLLDCDFWINLQAITLVNKKTISQFLALWLLALL